MIKQIVTDPEQLSIPAKPATEADAQVGEDLIDTMRVVDAASLAANQIGSDKAVIAYSDNGRTFVLSNPKLVSGIQRFIATEQCVSIEEPSVVERFKMIRVSYQALVGNRLEPRTRKFTGWAAQVVQHAIDHCEGKLV